MFESFDFQQMISAFIVLFAVIDIIGSIPIIINLKEKGKDVNAMKATVISFLLMFGLLIAGCSDNENEEELPAPDVPDYSTIIVKDIQNMPKNFTFDRVKDKRKSYQVKNVKIDISKSQNGITTIWLNNIHFKNFLKELWNTLQKTLDNGNWLHR